MESFQELKNVNIISNINLRKETNIFDLSNEFELQELSKIFNIESFDEIKKLMIDGKIDKIGFWGGALTRTILLKQNEIIKDYDLVFIGEENRLVFDKMVEELEKSGYKKEKERGESTTNLKNVKFTKDGKIYDFSLKKDFNIGTFDIDALYINIDLKENKLFISDMLAVNLLLNRETRLKEKTKSLYRLLGRIPVFVGKYDIETFYLDESNFNFLKTSSGLKNKEILNNFNEKIDSHIATSLEKFIEMIARVNNPYNYILKINNSNVIDVMFPNVSIVLKDDNFLNFLKKESSKKIEDRELKNDLDVFKKLYNYSKNKQSLLTEFNCLVDTHNIKKSNILNEIKGIKR